MRNADMAEGATGHVNPWLGALLIFAVATYPVDPYRIAGTGLSLYRISAVTVVGLTAFMIIWRGRVRYNAPMLLLLSFLAYIAAHYLLTGPHSSWGASKFNAYAFGSVFALSISQHKGLLPSLLLGIQLAFWITVPFVLYSLYTLLVADIVITTLPSLPGFSVGGGGWLGEGHNFQGLVRLAAPFPAPQFLGLLAAVAAFITLWQILRESRGWVVRWFRYLTLGAATFVVLGSLSRSALLPALLWMGTLLLSRARYRGTVVRFLLPAALVVAIVVGVGAQFGLGNIAAIALERATSASASFDRHLETRLTSLSLWGHSPMTILVGTSFGEYGRLWAADGPHSHSPYTTLLPEVGLVGLGLFVVLLALLLYRTRIRGGPYDLMFWLVAMLAFAFLLYEFLALQFVWCIIGVAASALPPSPQPSG